MLRISMTAEGGVRGHDVGSKDHSLSSLPPPNLRTSELGTAKLVVLLRLQGTQEEHDRPCLCSVSVHFRCPSVLLACLWATGFQKVQCALSRAPSPWYYLSEFSQTHRCPSGRQIINVTDAGLSSALGSTNQAGFPLSFPINLCLPHSTYLKETFLESWPQTVTHSSGS